MSGGWGTPAHQGGAVALGETFISDKSQQMARDLLAAAETLDLEPLVIRTVTNGFIAPTEVYETARSIRAEREGTDF